MVARMLALVLVGMFLYSMHSMAQEVPIDVPTITFDFTKDPFFPGMFGRTLGNGFDFDYIEYNIGECNPVLLQPGIVGIYSVKYEPETTCSGRRTQGATAFFIRSNASQVYKVEMDLDVPEPIKTTLTYKCFAPDGTESACVTTRGPFRTYMSFSLLDTVENRAVATCSTNVGPIIFFASPPSPYFFGWVDGTLEVPAETVHVRVECNRPIQIVHLLYGLGSSSNLFPPYSSVQNKPVIKSMSVFAGPPQDCQLALATSSPEVVPDKTSGEKTTSVVAHLSCLGQNPPQLDQVQGKVIQFSSVRSEGSGGHSHVGEPVPVGTFGPPSCVTDANGSCSVIYEASEVAGVETIYGWLAEKPSVQNTQKLTVRVPGLVEILQEDTFRLTGWTNDHPSNHFLATEGAGILGVASDFYEEFNATLGLNDMSLPYGGLFDLGPSSDGVFWKRPHDLHRKGRSVDVDRCAVSTIENNPNPRGPLLSGPKKECDPGQIKVPKDDRFRVLCRGWGGHLVRESKAHPDYIHCEF